MREMGPLRLRTADRPTSRSIVRVLVVVTGVPSLEYETT
jgi:hypothetical protein